MRASMLSAPRRPKARERGCVIASGDGTLASDVAHSIAESWPDRLVFTLGFPGAVSARLNAATHNGIAGNLLLGMDCLRPANGSDR